jgi:expansin (peptidoglycan-binding protein)
VALISAAGPLRAVWHGRRRWLVAGVIAALAAVVAVTLVVRTSGAACAAVPGRAAATTGKATYYTGPAGGNCSFGASTDLMYVALGPAEYRAGAACGEYLDVTGPKGSVRVKVADRCPECAAGHIDLSREAFAKIGAISAGIIPVTYRVVVNPTVPGSVTVRVKEGASRYWLAVLIDNHGNPLSSVEVRSGASWSPLSRTDYNYWIDDNGAGSGPFTLRVTDSAGRRATVSGIALRPGAVQATGVTMAGGAANPAAAAPTTAGTTGGPPSQPVPPAPASSDTTTTPAAPPGAAPSLAAPAPAAAERCG